MVGMVLAVLAGTGAVATQLVFDRWDRSVARDDLLDPDARHPGTAPDAGQERPRASPGGGEDVEGPLTFLVVGTDRPAEEEPDTPARADAIVVVRLAEDLRGGHLVSIPRDLRVPIPGHGEDKINAAYERGGGGASGTRLLSRTLTDLTGLRFDGAAVVDFAGFEAVIDTLGGVELCLEQPVTSIHTDREYRAGCQRLDGADALDVARQRYGLPRGDFDRGRNHQLLLQAIVAEARDSDLFTDPWLLDRTVRSVGAAVTADTGEHDLPQLALALRRLSADQLTGVTLPARSERIDGQWYVLAEPAADDLFAAIRTGRLDEWLADHPRWRND